MTAKVGQLSNRGTELTNAQEVSREDASSTKQHLLATIKTLEQRKNHYKETLGNTVESSKAEIAPLQILNQQNNATIESLRGENAALKRMTIQMQNQSIEAEKAEVQRLGTAFQKELLTGRNLKTENGKLKAEEAASQTTISEKQKIIDSTTTTNHQLEASVVDKDRTIKNLRESTTKLSKLDAETDRRNALLKLRQTELTKMHEDRAALRSNNQHLGNSIKDQAQLLSDLRTQIASYSAKTAKKDTTIKGLQTRNSSLAASLATYEADGVAQRKAEHKAGVIATLEAVKGSKERKVKEIEDRLEEQDIPLKMQKCLVEVYKLEIAGIERFLGRVRQGMSLREAGEVWEDADDEMDTAS